MSSCRWGPNAKETAAIKKYLDTQNVDTRAHPLVGGLEVDLPALYHAVQSFGGLSEVRTEQCQAHFVTG